MRGSPVYGKNYFHRVKLLTIGPTMHRRVKTRIPESGFVAKFRVVG
jgi:hypothetical protein